MNLGEWVHFALRDPVSAETHLAACAWAIFATLLLRRLCWRDPLKRRTVTCFGLCMVALYGASSAYHALHLPPAQLAILRKLDHSAIYMLIAGTYTPVFLVLLRGRLRQFLFGVMWFLALSGIAWSWVLPRSYYPLVVAAYLGMGWFGLAGIPGMAQAVGLRAVGWALLGGVFYTVGAACDLCRWPVLYPGVFGPHELLHVLVVGGTLCHFIFMVLYVVPFTRDENDVARSPDRATTRRPEEEKPEAEVPRLLSTGRPRSPSLWDRGAA